MDHRVSFFNKGVGNQPGFFPFHLNLATSDTSSFKKNVFYERQGFLANTILMEVVRPSYVLPVDDLYNEPLLIKIDVEGLDWDVLRFFKDILNRTDYWCVFLESSNDFRA